MMLRSATVQEEDIAMRCRILLLVVLQLCTYGGSSKEEFCAFSKGSAAVGARNDTSVLAKKREGSTTCFSHLDKQIRTTHIDELYENVLLDLQHFH